MTLDHDLDVLRIACGAYLERMRALWAAEPNAADVDVRRIVAAVGAQPKPDATTRRHVRARLAAAPAQDDDPLNRLAQTLDLTPGRRLLVSAAWWAQADPQFAILLGCGHDDGARRYASAALLRLVLEPFGVTLAPALDDDDRLVRDGVLEAGAGASEPLVLTATARMLLAGRSPEPLLAPLPAPARLTGQCAALTRRLRAGSGGAVLLRGPAGIGRRDVAIRAATAAGLVPVGPDRPAPELKLLARMRIAVPVVPADALDALAWTDADGPLVAWGPPGQRSAGAHVVDLRPPGHAERALCWRTSLEAAAGDAAAGDARVDADALSPVLAARFAFTEGDIAAAVARAALDAAWAQRTLDDDLVLAAARRQPEHALEHVAALVTPAFSLADLVLDTETEDKLRELQAHVALQHVVLDAWGFRRRLPRGQGVAALFAGPPGTGKTTAAEALALQLGHDLYRIDLSAVVSKYVGETEKNLASAFDEAERASAVLLFDEADALFGRRTEVRDAHDRYANLEVSYLLQRVETFTGLVILATNRESAIDDAFLRRLRFVIRFEAPDRALRRRLWQRSFPEGVRLGDLDLDALAEAELSGGNIQASALAAAYLAAADGGVITTAHVEHALAREHEKLGKAWAGMRAGVPA